MGITIAFLAYLEAENIKASFPAVKKEAEALGEPVEYIVVDTEKALDDTPEVCKQYGIRYLNQKWPHYGGAIRTAFQSAEMDKIFILDADGSPDPRFMRPMYDAMMAGADLVIGSRHIKGGANADSRSAEIMSNICNACFRIGLGMKVKDCSTSYRLYHTQDVSRLLLSSENFDVMEEILLKLRLTKGESFVVKEIPVQAIERQSGESKRSLLKFIYSLGRTLIKMVILRILAWRQYQPEKHERQAEVLTKAAIACSAILVLLLAAGVAYLLFVG